MFVTKDISWAIFPAQNTLYKCKGNHRLDRLKRGIFNQPKGKNLIVSSLLIRTQLGKTGFILSLLISSCLFNVAIHWQLFFAYFAGVARNSLL
jgi:hypothetical protein